LTSYTQSELAKIWQTSVVAIERLRMPRGPLRWKRVGKRGVRIDQAHLDEYERERQRLQDELQRLQHPVELSVNTLAGRREARERGREIARNLAALEAAKAAGLPPPRMSVEEWAAKTVAHMHKLNARKEAKRALRKKLRAYRFKAPQD
jgi:hypothetical protein